MKTNVKTTPAKDRILTSVLFSDALAHASESLKSRLVQFYSQFQANARHPEKLKIAGVGRLSGAAENYWLADLGEGDFCLIASPAEKLWIFVTAGSRAALETWAKQHLVTLNTRVNTIQIYEKTADEMGAGPLANCTDDALLGLGVPAGRLMMVRAFRTPEDLAASRRFLPADAADAVRSAILRSGSAFSRGVPVSGRPETANLSRFIESSETRSRFYEPDGADDFGMLASMPLAKWRCFLSADQRQLAETPRCGSFMVTGAAGTGKTVVLLHRAKYLLETLDWKPGEKMLFTTFSKNLAKDIRAQLETIIPSEKVAERIEVVNLDFWVREFLKSQDVDKEFIYPHDPLWSEAWKSVEKLMERHVGRKGMLPQLFYESEFELVILPNDVRTLRDYLETDRPGRGVTLGKRERETIWPVFERIRAFFDKSGRLTAPDAFYLARRMILSERTPVQYRAILVDESQDFGNEALSLLRVLTRNREEEKSLTGKAEEGDIFLAGDESQKIYNRPHDLSRCGINVRARRTKRLLTNYRTTLQNRSAALVVLEDNRKKLEEACCEKHLYRDEDCRSNREGPLPKLYAASGPEDEARWIVKNIVSLLTAGRGYVLSDFVIAAHSKGRRDEYLQLVRNSGLKAAALEGEDSAPEDVIRVSTLHRLKGLEFKVVFIAGADEGKMPGDTALEVAVLSGDVANAMKIQRSLFYVAMSRARDAVYVSCREAPGAFMRSLITYCSGLGTKLNG